MWLLARGQFGLNQQQTSMRVNNENKIVQKQISCMTALYEMTSCASQYINSSL